MKTFLEKGIFWSPTDAVKILLEFGLIKVRHLGARHLTYKLLYFKKLIYISYRGGGAPGKLPHLGIFRKVFRFY